MEEWKEIRGFPRYQISNLGRRKFIKKSGLEIITDFPTNKNKYIYTRLTNEFESKNFSVHNLVLRTFNPSENFNEVNHKNGLKWDNRLENLEWNTHKENIDHAIKNKLLQFKSGSNHHNFGKELNLSTKNKMKTAHNKNGNHPNYKLTDIQIIEIRKLREEGFQLKEIGDKFNQTIGNISMICSGKRRKNTT